MFVRVITFNGAKHIDEGVAYVRDTVIANLNDQKGFRGVTVSADRSAGVLGILTLWETEADRAASEGALVKNRQEGLDIIGGEMSVENFEQVVAEVKSPPKVGSPLTVTRVSMDPAKVDANLEFFKSDVVPRITSTPGFLALRNLINRTTGQGMVGVVFADEASREASAADAMSRREEATVRGVTFDDVGFREVLLSELR